jgi:hypothetical protein
MKIGVIADSHDRLPTLRRAVAMFVRMKVDALLHAGDFISPFAAKLIAPPQIPESLPVHCCFGNNDGERAGLRAILPRVVEGTVTVQIGGCRIAMNHFIDWFKPGQTDHADVVISGHTHEIVNEPRDGRLILNPGECCGWVTDRCTVALLDTATRQAQIVDIATGP